MDTKPTISERIVKAWGEMKNPALDGQNPHFRSKYSTMKAVMDVVRPACSNNGIAYQQLLESREGELYICSRVISETGETEWLSEYPVSNVPNAQSMGSELTYKKRQQACADWGLAGDDDDDGNESSAAVPNGPFTAKCTACGNAYQFQGAEHMAKSQCPQCGGNKFEVV